MFIEERHREILKIIGEKGRISIGEIQEKFGVSVDSARRDLRILESGNLLKRTHGGAIPLAKVGVKPPEKWSTRDIEDIDPFYNAIAIKACSFINKNDTIYITSASLGYLICKHLPTDIHFTVITNSIIIADELKGADHIDTFMIGGRIRSNGSCVDPFAIEFVRKLKIDTSFITGAGFSAEFGLSNSSAESAAFQAAVIKNSRRNIVLVPNNKVGFDAFVKVAEAKRFNMMITDSEASDDQVAKVRKLGVEVVIAEKE
jgi:DeoR/GlpR family transcriptional regulator of sugar metabolism